MYVFVYGTLMSGFHNSIAEFLRKNSLFIGKGKTKGEIYDLGSFPGAVFNENATNFIYGEVYQINSNTNAVIKALDGYEGIYDSSFDYYEKREAFIQVNNTQIKASVYHFKKSPDNFVLISHGDYSSYLKN
ncbi:gamma-glutamylcyclotransferase [Joostella atrarenae]|uniref:Gamma-glutamylcyclotransferase n=1 Tax=Joostella atrarenae TaxID=679257 RepID=A0ABS9J442_9FLAO|nr:gamma-glutamylcyclotransferase family protein [Joostella atrarenae]MCF8715169.1 gamma-glutamylcyclotransferase [Joostella atrarenae]